MASASCASAALLRPLHDLIRAHVKAVYTIGSAAEKIESHLRGVVSIHSCETLDRAVTTAATAAHPGEVVLLAPACSSFDQFESYEHRGRILEMGLLVGTSIELVRFAPLGDPVEIKVRGYHLTLRKHEADQIWVRPK